MQGIAYDNFSLHPFLRQASVICHSLSLVYEYPLNIFRWYVQNIVDSVRVIIQRGKVIIMDYLLHSEIIRTDEQ